MRLAFFLSFDGRTVGLLGLLVTYSFVSSERGSKNEFLLPEEKSISEIKLFIEQSRQQVVAAVHATLSAAIDESVKDFPLILY